MNIFEKIKAQVRLEDVAVHLMGESIRGMYRYPGERTPSVKVYSATQSFFDFGRGGVEAILLIYGVTSVTAMH